MTRVLAVSHTAIWPIRSGSSVRRSVVVDALSGHGPVDLLMLGETGDGAAGVPTDAPFERVWEMPVPRPGMSVFEKISWLIAPRRPIEVLEWGDRPSSPVADQSYDLIWYFRAVAYALAPNIQAQARIVDLDDLEDQKLRGRRGTARRQEPL
jgi:hypothetical protein